MDCKYTTQSVKMNKTVFRQTVEHPFDTEITLPDYCPDIHRVLKCRVNAKVAQRSAEGGKINIDGVLCLNLIYCDKDCGIRTFDVQTPFSKNLDYNADEGVHSVEVECRTDYCNCRASTERTVDVHAAVSMAISVVSCNDVSVIADLDAPHVQMKRSVAPASTPSGRAEKYLLINDEVSLPDKCPAIRNILRSDVNVVINEKKIIGNRVVVKGEIIMNVLYFGEETVDCETFKESIPFNQIVEVQGINDNCTCVVKGDIVSAELMPRTGMSGDMRVVSASVKLYLCVLAFCEGEIPYLTDAYSTKYDMQLGWSDVCFEKVTNSINESIKLKHSLDIPFSEEMQIVDLWCNPLLTGTATEHNRVNVLGNLQVCLIVRDKQGEPSYYERIYDLNEFFDVELPQKCDLRCNISPLGCNAVVNGNSIEVLSETNVCLDIIEQNQCKVISSAEFGDEHNRKCMPSSVVVYFAQQGDNVWDIARHYHTTPDAILSTNSMTTNEIIKNMTLVIPSV